MTAEMEIAILNETLPADAIFVLRAMGGGGYSLDLETIRQRSGLRVEAFSRVVGLLISRGLANRGAVSGSCVALYPTLRGCPLVLAAADPDSVVSRTLAARREEPKMSEASFCWRTRSEPRDDAYKARTSPNIPTSAINHEQILRAFMRILQEASGCRCREEPGVLACQKPASRCGCWVELLDRYDSEREEVVPRRI